MPAAYDYYDYPSYWKERDYEHASECLVLRHFLNKIKSIDRLIDVGAGYGRLTHEYIHRAKHITLLDPSARLLSIARNNLKSKKINYVHSNIANLKTRIKPKSHDLVVFIRVVHHLENPDKSFKTLNRILKNGGYLIMEFANNHNFKKTFLEFIKGNVTFPIEIFPKDIRCKENIKKRTLPFINYHPDDIKEKLENSGFNIIEKITVSNVRNSFIKKHLSFEMLLYIESYFQKRLSFINFGPSIFILAQKRTHI